MAWYEVEVAYQPDVERVTIVLEADDEREACREAYNIALDQAYPVLDPDATWATEIEEK